MKYHWLAHYLVQEKFPKLDEQTRNLIVSEAICRAWCSFVALDYRLMQACVEAAAQTKGVVTASAAEDSTMHHVPDPLSPRESLGRARVIRLSDYR